MLLVCHLTLLVPCAVYDTNVMIIVALFLAITQNEGQTAALIPLPEWFEIFSGVLFMVMSMIATLSDIGNIMPGFWFVFFSVIFLEGAGRDIEPPDDLTPTQAPTTSEMILFTSLTLSSVLKYLLDIKF